MAIQIGNYNFDGPHGHTSAIHARSGVYAILGKNAGTQWVVVDVGESENVRDRIDSHDRRPCWQRRGHQELAAAVLYVPEQQRMNIERELRIHYDPPCGDR